jgi:hypothetical protein
MRQWQERWPVFSPCLDSGCQRLFAAIAQVVTLRVLSDEKREFNAWQAA